MAIARCSSCGQPRANKPPAYGEKPYLPVGHPRSGLVCGKRGCHGDPLIWLKLDEEDAYRKGKRIFDIPTNSAKIKVQ